MSCLSTCIFPDKTAWAKLSNALGDYQDARDLLSGQLELADGGGLAARAQA